MELFDGLNRWLGGEKASPIATSEQGDSHDRAIFDQKIDSLLLGYKRSIQLPKRQRTEEKSDLESTLLVNQIYKLLRLQKTAGLINDQDVFFVLKRLFLIEPPLVNFADIIALEYCYELDALEPKIANLESYLDNNGYIKSGELRNYVVELERILAGITPIEDPSGESQLSYIDKAIRSGLDFVGFLERSDRLKFENIRRWFAFYNVTNDLPVLTSRQTINIELTLLTNNGINAVNNIKTFNS